MRRRNEIARRPEVTAAFTLSWDGRMLEESERCRELASKGLPDELCITFRPRILGGKSAPTITGLDENFLPQGITLDLLKLERRGDECVARYRVQGNH